MTNFSEENNEKDLDELFGGVTAPEKLSHPQQGRLWELKDRLAHVEQTMQMCGALIGNLSQYNIHRIEDSCDIKYPKEYLEVLNQDLDSIRQGYLCEVGELMVKPTPEGHEDLRW